MIRAVLFDVGGPLDTEVIYEGLIDQHIREALADEGVVVSDEEYAAAARYAVESFAWNAQQAIIWRLSGQQSGPARRAYGRLVGRAGERHAAIMTVVGAMRSRVERPLARKRRGDRAESPADPCESAPSDAADVGARVTPGA